MHEAMEKAIARSEHSWSGSSPSLDLGTKSRWDQRHGTCIVVQNKLLHGKALVMSVISLGFVATSILISMFLIMAIFEHLFRPNTSSFSSPQHASNRPSSESTKMHKLGVHPHLVTFKTVPKRIMDLTNVEGLTRENMASHLQKYRLYLKRISSAASQQAYMIVALGVKDASYLRMGTLDELGDF